MTIKFIQAPADADKGFRAGSQASLFVNGAEFQITGYVLGNYEITKDDGSTESTKYASSSQSIVFKTSLGEDLPLRRLLNKRRLIYDADGHAFVVESCSFKAPLWQHLEQLGRRPDDPSMFKGSADDVAKHVMAFFKDKTIYVKGFDGFGRDDKNRMVPLLSPAVQFQFKD